ncbi:MAG: NAD(P)-dependent oxidoreductase [Planctomycetota bacterium]|nr:MAG: NAD(P)-dependent oxidoreductase [Planctomycetota bacterium]REJ94599.1 MAG: NAD(P)-dependent oxidoreductase [Planctomycetota bacterium]REK29063.1 MAG: NAD(P)-dependent oxidoreductase [Planctomycetota bacterium]REK46630.1 MAG: NAD(P)-dependent oxidoreductase [Planctomycetota bacterium]
MKVLVTGGAGYVGTVLAPQLLSAGHEVVVLDSLRNGGQALLPFFEHSAFSFIRGNVHDAELVQRVVADCDAVVHLAAIVGFPACRKHPDLAKTTNVEGTRNVAQAIRAGQPFVYASTGSNYGKLETVCTEESPLHPVSLYAITKTQGEEIALAAGGIGLRFATAFGVSPRLRLDLLINDFVHQAVVNKQIIVYEQHFRRTFIHVRDMARAFCFALDQAEAMRGETYNVGHESLNLTKEDVALAIRERVPFYLHFADVGADPDQRDYDVSYEKIRKLGYQTIVTLDEGIEQLIRAMDVVEITSPFTNV